MTRYIRSDIPRHEPIRTLRERAALTQAALVRAAGTSQPAIAAYEAETRSPTISTVERLAAEPDRVLGLARRNLERMAAAAPAPAHLLREGDVLYGTFAGERQGARARG